LAKQKVIRETVSAQRGPGWWDSRIQPFLERRALAVALGFILLACIRIPLASRELGLTSDEPQHFACGLEYLAKHVYRYETQHPPLARVMTALIPYLSGARPTGKPDREDEGVGILIHASDPDAFLASMRLGILPFFVAASLITFFWTRYAFDGPTAVFATLLFTLLPPVLAHAGLATTDMGLTACLAAAFYSAVRWCEVTSVKRSVLFGLATAAAALTKFTSLVYLPAAFAIALVAWYLAAKPTASRVISLIRFRAAFFGLAVLVGAIAIWAAYFFHFDTFPAPEFFDGIASVREHNRGGHLSYLLGNVSWSGFWYYFPVVLAVKTPIAFLILLAIGFGLACRNRASLSYGLPLALALGILFPAMTGHINIGVRHVLPVYVPLSILAAAGLARLSAHPKLAITAAVLILWMAASGFRSHPDYLAYFNEFAGNDPERILVDSDLDWGQSTKMLARRLKELGAAEVGYGVDNGRSNYLQVWPGLPKIRPIHPVTPAEGWTAVNPTTDRTAQYGLYHRYPGRQPWFDDMEPVERVGPLRLYYIAPGTLRRVR